MFVKSVFFTLISSSHFCRHFHRFFIYLSPPSSLIFFFSFFTCCYFHFFVRFFSLSSNALNEIESMSSYFFGRSFILFVIYIFLFQYFLVLLFSERIDVCGVILWGREREFGAPRTELRWLLCCCCFTLSLNPSIVTVESKSNVLVYRTVFALYGDLILAGPHTLYPLYK